MSLGIDNLLYCIKVISFKKKKKLNDNNLLMVKRIRYKRLYLFIYHMKGVKYKIQEIVQEKSIYTFLKIDLSNLLNMISLTCLRFQILS